MTTNIEVTYAEGDGTTKVDTLTGQVAAQVFDGGRAMVWLYDERRQVVGWVQYTRASRIAAGAALAQLRPEVAS